MVSGVITAIYMVLAVLTATFLVFANRTAICVMFAVINVLTRPICAVCVSAGLAGVCHHDTAIPGHPLPAVVWIQEEIRHPQNQERKLKVAFVMCCLFVVVFFSFLCHHFV